MTVTYGRAHVLRRAGRVATDALHLHLGQRAP